MINVRNDAVETLFDNLADTQPFVWFEQNGLIKHLQAVVSAAVARSKLSLAVADRWLEGVHVGAMLRFAGESLLIGQEGDWPAQKPLWMFHVMAKSVMTGFLHEHGHVLLAEALRNTNHVLELVEAPTDNIVKDRKTAERERKRRQKQSERLNREHPVIIARVRSRKSKQAALMRTQRAAKRHEREVLLGKRDPLDFDLPLSQTPSDDASSN